MSENKDITLDDVKVTKSELDEARNSLASDERIVETSENNFVKLKRMNGSIGSDTIREIADLTN